MTRRDWLAGLMGILGLAALGCGKSAEDDPEDRPLPPNRLPPEPRPPKKKPDGK